MQYDPIAQVMSAAPRAGLKRIGFVTDPSGCGCEFTAGPRERSDYNGAASTDHTGDDMAEEEHKVDAPKEPQAIGQIVGYLKNYPFLLITIAGLVILASILIFPKEKLEQFKWLIYAVVLVPLAIQFFIELQKTRNHYTRSSSHAAPATGIFPQTDQQPATLPASRKAWTSIGLSILALLSLSADQQGGLANRQTAVGLLVFAFAAAGLAYSAKLDAQNRVVRGKGVAITGLVMAIVLMLAGIGALTGGDAVPVIPTVGLAGSHQPAAQPTTGGLPAMQAAMPDQAAAPAPDTGAIVGRYHLLTHAVDNVPQMASGMLTITRQAGNMLAWQARMTAQNPQFTGTFDYKGYFGQQPGKGWVMRITASNDPNWRDLGEVPMELAFDGVNAVFRYRYGENLVMTVWSRV